MRILGIDLGSSSIKAVEMDSAFGRYDIHDYHEQTLMPDISLEQAIQQMMNTLSKPPDRIVVALQTGQTTFRRLQLPTRDKKAIQAGVGYELEDELPFSVDECAYDYVTVTQNKSGSTVHVAATLNRYLKETIQGWQRAGTEPDVITTEAWAYRTLLNRVIGATAQQPLLLVQIGHQRTTVYLHWQDAPCLIREIPWGGSDLNRAMGQKYDISLEQAELAKMDRGGLSQSDPEFSEFLKETLGTLISEIKQVELMAKNVTHHTISCVYISGGTSLLPGLLPWIEEMIGISTKPILALSSATPSGVTYSDQTDARFLLAVALTLTLVGPDRANCINFRQGIFSKQGTTRQINLNALRKPILAAAIVLVCLLLSLTVQSAVYKSRLTSTDLLLEKSVRSFFGQLSSSALRTYMANPSTLRTSINKELAKQRELSKLFGPNVRSPLNFLNSVSTAIPKDVVVDLTQFHAGMNSADSFVAGDSASAASLSFLVSNPQVAEKVALLMNNKLSHFERGKMEEVSVADGNTPPGSNKKWKITFSGKPNENNYGN